MLGLEPKTYGLEIRWFYSPLDAGGVFWGRLLIWVYLHVTQPTVHSAWSASDLKPWGQSIARMLRALYVHSFGVDLCYSRVVLVLLGCFQIGFLRA